MDMGATVLELHPARGDKQSIGHSNIRTSAEHRFHFNRVTPHAAARLRINKRIGWDRENARLQPVYIGDRTGNSVKTRYSGVLRWPRSETVLRLLRLSRSD